jgi:hypothetical protein
MDRLRDEAWSRNAVDRSNLLLDFSKPWARTGIANTHRAQPYLSSSSFKLRDMYLFTASIVFKTCPHPLEVFWNFFPGKKHRDVPRVSAIITNASPPPHRQSTPGASCELPPSRGPSPSHQIMSQTRHARRTSFPQQTITPPACHPFFFSLKTIQRYRVPGCAIITSYPSAEIFDPNKCRASRTPVPKSPM